MAKQKADTLPTRRDVLLLGATGLVTLIGFKDSLIGKVYGDTAVTSTPALEEGPYWVDETGTTFHRSDVRANVDGTNVQAGLPMYLSLTVSQISSGVVTPLKNAFVYMWQANALGVYSDETSESTSGQTYLRGYQVTNERGNVQFIANYPGWYSGRTIHTHLRIRLYPSNDPTQTPTYDYESQIFYDQNITDYVANNVSPYKTRTPKTPDTLNSTDRVYTGGSLDADGVTSNAGALTTTYLDEKGSHADASYHVILNLALTEPTGGTGGPGGGPGGP